MKKKVVTKSSSTKAKKKPATTVKKKLVATVKKTLTTTAKKRPTTATKRTPIKEDELYERIRIKAFELYCSRDPYAGNNVGDWVAAEKIVKSELGLK